jgi:Meckel syndrome type 1 protein
MASDRDDINDPVLAQLLREGADESPPAHVDAAILAEARRAVELRRRVRNGSPPLWRWLLPLGAAATIAAIVISVRPLAPTAVEPTSSADNVPARQADQGSPVDRAAPASANALAPAPAKPQQRMTAKAPPVASVHERPTQGQEARKATDAEAPATASAAAPATASAAAPAAAPAAPPVAALGGPRAAAPAAVAPPREEAAARVDAGQDPTVWIERIRTLLRESRRAEAAQELERFRAAFADADARLPDDLRAFAAQARAKPAAPR